MSYLILIVLDIYSVLFLPDVITKSYSQLMWDWIANASKMAVNVRDKLELEIFRTTAGNLREFGVC